MSPKETQHLGSIFLAVGTEIHVIVLETYLYSGRMTTAKYRNQQKFSKVELERRVDVVQKRAWMACFIIYTRHSNIVFDQLTYSQFDNCRVFISRSVFNDIFPNLFFNATFLIATGHFRCKSKALNTQP